VHLQQRTQEATTEIVNRTGAPTVSSVAEDLYEEEVVDGDDTNTVPKVGGEGNGPSPSQQPKKKKRS
jgi:hypothetical protein